MYNVFINTHAPSTSAETFQNIQPEKSLKPGVDLISLLPSDEAWREACWLLLCSGFIEKLLQSFHLKSAKEMVKEILTFLKVTGLQDIAAIAVWP